jgi:hypothetical protein
MSQLAGLIIGDRSATAPAGWSRTSLARIRVLKTGSAQRHDATMISTPVPAAYPWAARRGRERCFASPSGRRCATPATNRHHHSNGPRTPLTATHSPRSFIGRPPVPMPIKERDRATGEETGETITLFKTVFVFDAQQVHPLPAGQPTPLGPPSQPLTGDSHAHLIAPASAFAESLGYTVSFESIAGSAGGWCDPGHHKIVVDADVAPNARLRTLVHEAIHALGVDYHHYPRARAEVIVDTATLGSVSTSPARPSPTAPAGAKTAPSKPSPSSPSSSTRSPAASKPHSTSPVTPKGGVPRPPERWLASSRVRVVGHARSAAKAGASSAHARTTACRPLRV